ncbi:MAG: nicotinate-nucleotide--dimethylbenzimidazole phosphoribosyltransferase [Nitrospirae bacterium]|nr:nicotinate-nucleotide--dimethylbenzimidazole phosphoribosyltransferase [Nitrospirota bacterium]
MTQPPAPGDDSGTASPGLHPPLSWWAREIRPVDSGFDAAIRYRIDHLTKPLGSLGRIEEVAFWYASLHGSDRPPAPKGFCAVFAADHGVTAEGVSAYPQSVTRQMVLNYLAGGAAISVLSRVHGFDLKIVDVGVNGDLAGHPSLLHRKVRHGTRNFAVEPAMMPEEGLRAMEAGMELAVLAAESGATLLLTGEMGIGNTTSASALAAALLRHPPEDLTGSGTGLTPEGKLRKIRVIDQALASYRPLLASPLDWLFAVGGLEIAALAGFIIGGAVRRIPVVLDGFITGTAALAAVTLIPEVRPWLMASHMSMEPGHRRILEHLGLSPLLALDLRLGEGSGAALAYPLVVSAVSLYNDMATFEEARVSQAGEG